MNGRNSLDATDQSILRILSVYEGLTPLELWYELGEDDAVKVPVTEEEVLNRLKSLRKRGLVEKVTDSGVGGNSSRLIYRVKTSE